MEQIEYLLYLVVNKINGKFYVGKTSRGLDRRWKEHKNSSVNYKKKNYFFSALKKWGLENFDICVIDRASSMAESSELEKQYIQAFRSCSAEFGYNTSLGGEGVHPNEVTKKKISDAWVGKTPWWIERGVPHPRQGAHLPEESKRKISEKKKGTPCSERSKEVSRSRRGPLSPTFGVKRTPEQREAISKVHKGKKLSQETKDKIGEASSRRKHTPEAKAKISQSRLGENNPMFGVLAERHHRFRKDITMDLISPLLLKNMSINQISKQLGCTRKVVQSRIDRQ